MCISYLWSLINVLQINVFIKNLLTRRNKSSPYTPLLIHSSRIIHCIVVSCVSLYLVVLFERIRLLLWNLFQTWGQHCPHCPEYHLKQACIRFDKTLLLIFAYGQKIKYLFWLMRNSEMKERKCHPKSPFKKTLGNVPKYGQSFSTCGAVD